MGIKIDFKPEVYDDPEYCKGENTECDYYFDSLEKCELFLSVDLEYCEASEKPKKCQECKEHYQKGKERERKEQKLEAQKKDCHFECTDGKQEISLADRNCIECDKKPPF